MNETILAHAAACTPVESCDWVVNTSTGERYFPCQNLSAEPTMYFHMDPADYLQAQATGDVVVLVHNHPDGLPFLGDVDRRLQVQNDLSWWLVCDGRIYKFRCMSLLAKRAFEHGVTGCYTLFRDAYHLAGIKMSDFARKEDWQKQGGNPYLDNPGVIGFYRANAIETQPKDILICCFDSSVTDHAAIYCGDGELLHHIPNQLSKRERYIDKWQRHTHSIWRHRAWHESAFTGIYSGSDIVSTSI